MSRRRIDDQLQFGTSDANKRARFSEVEVGQHARIVIKTDGRFVFLDPEEIDWIEAKGNYVCLHAGTESYVQRQALGTLEQRLEPGRFLRIHRSVIVNVDKIRELRPWPTGEYVVVMRNGKELTLSRGYRNQLSKLLGEVPAREVLLPVHGEPDTPYAGAEDMDLLPADELREYDSRNSGI